MRINLFLIPQTQDNQNNFRDNSDRERGRESIKMDD